MSTQPSGKASLFSSVLQSVSGAGPLRAEKARLEAFLSAVPGEYCGWAPDGTLAYSKGFCALLGIDAVRDIADIQGALSPGDAAALDGLHTRLQEDGESFSLRVRTLDRARALKISGSRGRDRDGQESFDVLWMEDVTKETQNHERASQARSHAEAETDRLQAALDHVAMPMWLRGGHGDLLWCNRAYAAALDISPATVVAEQRELPTTASQKKTTGQKGANPLQGLAQSALQSGGAGTMRVHVIVGGNRRLMAVTEAAIPALGLTVGAARDITREEELETELNRYLTANKELLEQLRTAIAMYGPDQKLEFYNSAFSQLWDLEGQWLDGRPKLGDIMEKLRETRRLPEQTDFRKYKQSWLSMFTGLIDPHEDMLHLPDGSALRMLAIPHPMGGLMMTFEDVTSRLELESSYNTLIAVQKETLDHLAEGVAVFGGDGRLKLWNPSFARLWTLNPEDLDGEPHITRLIERRSAHFTEAEWPKMREKLIALGLDRTQQSGRIERMNSGVLDYATVPLPDGGVLVTWSDVTDTVRVENALRDKNAALEAAERLKLDFLANVSYQLRTPLNAIMGFTEILQNEYFGPLNIRQKEYVSGMHEAGDRLLGLINDILDLSTIEAGYLSLETRDIALKETLESLVGLTEEWAAKEKISIRLRCPDNIGILHADERRLKQVILNLIRNAITFTPSGGKITLSADRSGREVEIAVSDTGVGIVPEDQERVFEPFERVQNAVKSDGRTARGGAGLGLSLVRNIMRLHGGEVRLESIPGKGTTVRLLFPVARAGRDQ